MQLDAPAPTSKQPSQFYNKLKKFVDTPSEIKHVFFAGCHPAPAHLAYQVNFSRLEIVLDGEINMEIGGYNGVSYTEKLSSGNVLFLPDLSWNQLNWDSPVTMISLLFGKENIGFSIINWDGEQFNIISKENIQRRGPRVGSYILKSLQEAAYHQEDQSTARLLISSLLSYALNLTQFRAKTLSQSQVLFESVSEYIAMHYYEPLTRESVAEKFYISANYLSQLFHKEGDATFNEYLTKKRIDIAKKLLSQNDLKIKDVSVRCGFTDCNYFCRIFRQYTSRTPSKYRAEYRSKLIDSIEKGLK